MTSQNQIGTSKEFSAALVLQQMRSQNHPDIPSMVMHRMRALYLTESVRYAWGQLADNTEQSVASSVDQSSYTTVGSQPSADENGSVPFSNVAPPDANSDQSVVSVDQSLLTVGSQPPDDNDGAVPSVNGEVPTPLRSRGISFSLHREDDIGNINAAHIIVRRDILEGFVVDDGDLFGYNSDAELTDREDEVNRRAASRIRRYQGTVGFRCRFCKDQPASKRALKHNIFPESIHGLYRANIRFMDQHIPHCQFIPSNIKRDFEFLHKKLNHRGRKQEWEKSARRIGLHDVNLGNKNAIIFFQES